MHERDFDDIWRKYQNDLFYFILSLVGDGPISAQDILHDVYLKAFMSIDQLHDSEKAKTWLLKIAKNKVLDEIKRNKKHMTVDLSLLDELDELISHDEMNLNKIIIDEYLKMLPADFRKMLYLHIYYDFTAVELAQMYNMSYIATRQHLLRAKRKIAKLLATCEMTRKEVRIIAEQPAKGVCREK